MISCRSCGSTGLLSILSLGNMPLANALLTQGQLVLLEILDASLFLASVLQQALHGEEVPL